jgi:hypothetical protein
MAKQNLLIAGLSSITSICSGGEKAADRIEDRRRDRSRRDRVVVYVAVKIIKALAHK